MCARFDTRVVYKCCTSCVQVLYKLCSVYKLGSGLYGGGLYGGGLYGVGLYGVGLYGGTLPTYDSTAEFF